MSMPKFRPRSLGVKITLKFPELYLPILDVIDNQSIGNIIREAMRSAGRPAVVALKSLLKSELIKSDQSTGATERSVTMKYGRSKTRPSNFYMIVGVDKSHIEIHTSQVPSGFTTKLKKGKQRGRGLFGMQTRTNKKKVSTSKQVFSRYRNDFRLARMNGRPFKRIPKKYFHLIDRGFNHYKAGPVAGYDFIRRLQASLNASIQNIFNQRIKDLIIPVIQKEMIRKIKSVLK